MGQSDLTLFKSEYCSGLVFSLSVGQKGGIKMGTYPLVHHICSTRGEHVYNSAMRTHEVFIQQKKTKL